MTSLSFAFELKNISKRTFQFTLISSKTENDCDPNGFYRILHAPSPLLILK